MGHPELNEAIKQAGRPAGLTPAGMTGHDVEFYRSESQLIGTVTEFLAAGLRASQPLIVIATAAHRKALAESLKGKGLDTEDLHAGRDAQWLDARETLDAIMEHGLPNPELFAATVGAVFERVLRKRTYLIVRGYGEMVDLLAQDGNFDGAEELERLWNDLAARYSYSLLCGYSLHNFLHGAGTRHLRGICGLHTHANGDWRVPRGD